MMRASTFIPDCLLKLAILRKQEYKLTLFISMCPSICLYSHRQYIFVFHYCKFKKLFPNEQKKLVQQMTLNDIK